MIKTGSYVLLIHLKVSSFITIGRLGEIFFKEGYYIYIGSALSGIDQRVQRHLRSEKKVHWHIDYLLQHATIKEVYYRESTSKEECLIAQYFSNIFEGIIGFGCSDCHCKSHLYYINGKDLKHALSDLALKEYNKNT